MSEKLSNETILPDDADFALLQQPIFAGVKNVRQILVCVQDGSREIKDLVLNECDLLYECKMCKNIFRSLANFLFHKRCFCKKHNCESMLLFECSQDPQPIVVPSEPVIEENKDDTEAKDDGSIEEDLPNLSLQEADTNVNAISNLSSSSEDHPLLDLAVPMDTHLKEEKSDQHSVEDQANVDHHSVEDQPNVGHRSVGNQPNVDHSVEDQSNVDHSVEDQSNVDHSVEDQSNVDHSVEDQSNVDHHYISESNAKSMEIVPRKTFSPIKIYPSFFKITMKDRVMESCKNLQIKVLTNEKGEKKPTLILKSIDGNKNAVFQEMEGKKSIHLAPAKVENVSIEGKASGIITSTPQKDSVLKFAPEKTDTSVSNSSEGTRKGKDIQLTRRKRLLRRTDCHVQSLKCLKCDTEFTTLKTLYFHMMSLHSKKRMYYPCPICNTLFVQMYGVTRHLISAHNKTKTQIDNKMREAIRKSVVWKQVDEANGKAEHKKVKPEKENDRVETVKTETVKSFEQSITKHKMLDEKIFHSYVRVELTEHQCSKCKRVFGRKSSQVSHQKFCIMNNTPTKSDSSEQSPPSPIRPSYSPGKSQLAVVTKKLNFTEPRVNPRPKRGAEKRMHKDFVDSQTLKWRSANKIETTTRASVRDESKTAFKTHEKKIKAIINVEKLLCIKCHKKFSSFSNLRRHAAIHIGWTRFECKSCNYQSYNKSECRHHLERVHSISEANVDKYIINLVSDVSQGKLMNSTIANATAQKERKTFVAHKNKLINRKKHIQKKSNSTPTVTPNSKYRTSPRKSTSDESSSPGSKRQRKTRVITITKPPPVRKLQTPNYKSVTTNCPTTIILSKNSETTSVQMPKPASSIVQNTESSSSFVKSTRASPRKFEVTMKVMTDTALTSTPTPISRTSLQLPSQVFSGPSKTEFIDLNRREQTDKPAVKKRDISDWFIKEDKTKNMQFPPVKRDSAPLIIGLVPVSNSRGVFSQKNK